MSSLWQSLLNSLKAGRRSGGQDPTDFPHTYAPWGKSDTAARPQVFDPALKQFGRALRLGEPGFSNEPDAQRWRAARRRAMNHLLALVARSPWRSNLVLRGSVLLKAWLGGVAREPGDLDWVVTPPTIAANDIIAREMIEGIIELAEKQPLIGDVTLLVDRVAFDEIWTYDRAPGHRVVFPWQAEGLPPGDVQMDFVFCERLPDEPIELALPSAERDAISVRAASPQASLAWKFLWLQTDAWPQGKDLYDAALLAEHAPLPAAILMHVFSQNPGQRAPLPTAESIAQWQPDWENFKTEYPWVRGSEDEWKQRLIRALGPTLNEISPPSGAST